MEELQVVVKQEPGVIRWNFDDLKEALKKEMSTYEGMIYDDSSIKMAKSDVALLRKLRKAVEDKRKEIKNTCLEPYAAIEAQAKELTGLIDKPIATITKQVGEYEDKQKADRRARVMEYMAEMFKAFPPEIQKKAQFACYDTKWENATAKVGEWMGAIENMADKITSELDIVCHVDPDFKEAVMKVYSQNLSLPDAMQKAQELQHQKEMLEARQKQREEEQRRQEAEAAVRAAQKNEPQEVQESPAINYAPETHKNEFEKAQQAEPQTVRGVENDGSRTFKLYGDDKQINKILQYIAFMGVKVEEITYEKVATI